jgi:2-polyprenyl-3-methyl-5-hydroxy-6-metoxy-1,4-benzoquinol methylase
VQSGRMDDDNPAQEPTLAEFWEGRYGDAERVWSGHPNRTLVDVVTGLPVGRALDLGCGEGGDAIWLAQQGWQVTAVDVSRTAITRAEAAAAGAGVPPGRIRWQAHDLATWPGNGTYELVAASFLHSPVEIPRSDILRRAAGLVAPGGHLFLLSHAALPPWSRYAHEHEHYFPTPAEEVESLELAATEWESRIVETREREATGPDGQLATLVDVVVLLHRR